MIEKVAADSLNPKSFEEAKVLVQEVEGLFNNWNLQAILDGFTDDAVTKFRDIPIFSGKDQLRKLFEVSERTRKDFALTKTLKSFSGNVICNTWDCTWVDVQSKKKMAGFGCEFWTMRDGKIAIWEGTFNGWEVRAVVPA